MINGLDNSIALLNGLSNIYDDNITSVTYEDTTIGNYLSGITSNVQTQLNLIGTTAGITILQTLLTDYYNTQQSDKTTLSDAITSLSSTVIANYNSEIDDIIEVKRLIIELTSLEINDVIDVKALITENLAAQQSDKTTLNDAIVAYLQQLQVIIIMNKAIL